MRSGDEFPTRMKSIGPRPILCVRVEIDLCAARESLKRTEHDSPQRMTAVARA